MLTDLLAPDGRFLPADEVRLRAAAAGVHRDTPVGTSCGSGVTAAQLALALHVRNTLIDAAAAGARYGTLADRSPEDGVERTRRIVSGALGPRYAQDVVATTAAVGELRTLEITVVSPLPVVALFGPPDSLEVRGHAVLGD